MDTSEQYIKMCDDQYIQDLWTPADWDTCYCKSKEQQNEDEQVVVLSGYETDSGCYGHETPERTDNYYWSVCGETEELFHSLHIWLPRQDQLQAMIEPSPSEFMCEFTEWYYKHDELVPIGINTYCEQFKTMEQLWLAFVMKEKYSKQWNGEEWKNG